MTTAYTSLLGLALPVTGELSGTWGDVVNQSITSLLDTSVAGTTNISTDANVTLTTTTGAANQARQAILLFSGARTAIRTVTAPAQSKIYTVINATTGGFAVTLVGAGPTTGVTIANGARTVVAWNGSDFVEVSSPSSIILPGGTANGVLYLNGSKVVTSGSALAFDGTNALTLFRTTATEANEPTIKFSNLTFAGQNAGVVKSSNGGLALDIQSPSDSTFQLRSRIYMSGGSGNNISFQASSDNGSTYSERMVLTSTGLGIGTSSPLAKLDVKFAADKHALLLSSSSYSNGADLVAANDTGSEIALGLGGNTVRFYTGATERMRLDSSGNLGLGVTPSAWNSDLRAFQVGNIGSYFANGTTSFSGSQWTWFGNNGHFNSSSQWIYTRSQSAAQYRQLNNEHAWFNAPSGTAGNAITFTQAMTLDASSNLMVGGTSVLHSAKITSYGSIVARNNGVDGTFQNAFIAAYDQNSNENNVIQTSVSSSGTGSGFRFKASDGGGSSSTTTVLDLTRTQTIFYTGGTERARIDSSGNLLVGTTSQISVAGVTAAHALVTNSSNQWATGIRNSTSGTPWGLALNYNNAAPNNASSDYIYCYDTTLRMAVRSNGGISNYSGNDVNLSDRREKTNFAPAKSYLETICAIPVQTFNYIDQNMEEDGGLTLGVVAQDVQAVAPELVMESNWGTEESPKMRLSIYQTDLQYALMKCIQEQQAIIESLKARLDAANL